MIVNKSAIIFCLILVTFTNCRKFIKSDAPYTTISAENIYTTDATAASVLTGIYAKLSFDNTLNYVNSFSGVSLLSSLSADEFTLFNLNDQSYLPFYKNTLSPADNQTLSYWKIIYPVVYMCNAAIIGLNKSTTLTANVKNQLIGEAKFVRAFCFFYLTNLYGEIPLPVSTDYAINSSLTRLSKAVVYDQIISDLKDAKDLLSDNYLKGDAFTAYTQGAEEKVRPTKWAATALLARTYLYINDWINAEEEATMVINNNASIALESLSSAFKKNNKEAIWQLQPTSTGTTSNTGEGRFFILPSSGPSINYPVYLSKNLIESFEMGDKRKTSWVDSVKPSSVAYYFPAKYKIGAVNTNTQEYSTIIRLSEVYLIRAEARTQRNNLTGAIGDLDKIRNRAQLTLIAITNPSASKEQILNLIIHERQVELFTEWGHRWLDLKRTGKIDNVMSNMAITKGSSWETTDQLYPITDEELSKAPNLMQNPGY